MKKNKSSGGLYSLLEVSPRARPSVIKAAYNTLMKEYHPDIQSGNDRIAKELNKAKQILLDKKKRKKYDKDIENLEGVIIGNYRVDELIAEGGFGKTYKGEHIVVGEPVCIKHAHYVSPQDEEILLDEAKSIWDLRHFGIPTMRDMVKMDDDSLALVMSYVPGPTLEQIVENVGGLDPEHVAWLTERALNVLKYLHFNGVVHGDVKPQNIIIQPENHTVVLVDYGLSLVRPSYNSESIGYTPLYASPEQEKGFTLLPESDFYSLGMTMIYALGGDVIKRKVPKATPDSMCDFIKEMLVYDILSRPNWQKGDLCQIIQKIRKKEFGRTRSGMKPIPGI
ncbi:MAG: protein kinase [Nanoarchaeota archaeon]|nr:protein kinase [Nanoarchaeota archaeon]